MNPPSQSNLGVSPNSVPSSAAMVKLLSDRVTSIALHRAFPDIQRVLLQIQLDITTPENRDLVGPTLLALRHVHDIFQLSEAKGAVIEQQIRTKNTP